MNDNHLWGVTITFTDGTYYCDIWATTPGVALQMAMIDARGVESTPLFTGAPRAVNIIWKEKLCSDFKA
jgi:hypothetical protein